MEKQRLLAAVFLVMLLLQKLHLHFYKYPESKGLGNSVSADNHWGV